jgi:ribosomal protein S18 acetylase RimI-like enzyme
MDASIRRATTKDAEAMAALGAETFVETYGHLYPTADLEAYLAAAYVPSTLVRALADPEVAAWVAVADGRMVGFSQARPADLPHPDLRPWHGELQRLYLRASHQKGGLGSRLIAPALDWLAARGRTPVWLNVYTGAEAAQRFYERHGFRKVGEMSYMVGSFPDPAYVMRRDQAWP